MTPNLNKAWTAEKSARAIAEDYARRILQEGLPAILESFKNDGLSERAVSLVLDNCGIIEPSKVQIGSELSLRLACELLAVELWELNRVNESLAYDNIRSGAEKTLECA